MRISIVVPVRDGERYLGAALDSLRGQRRPPDELIVVDDGSVDGSAAVAQSVAGVRLLRMEPGGAAAARNAGALAATGNAIGFLDADDLADPRRLELQEAALLADNGLDAVGAHMESFLTPESAQELEGRLVFLEGPVPGFHAGTLLIRRGAFERVGPFDERLPGGEVIDWLDRARGLGLDLQILSEVLLRRRVHGANLTLQRDVVGSGYVAAARAAILRRREGAGAP